MKIYWLTTSSNNVHTVMNSLAGLGAEYQITAAPYDHRWHRACDEAIQGDPNIRQALQAGMWPPPGQREAFRPRVSCDEEMIATAKALQPDVIIYTSAWEGLFVPKNETLAELNTIAPVIHLLFDGADPPWWPQLKQFEADKCFALTVNIDGSHYWPGGRDWPGLFMTTEDAWKVENALTLLTPLDPTPFRQGVEIPFDRRAFAVAYAGNAGGWTRSHLVQQLQKAVPELAFRQRDDHPMSYPMFVDFLKRSKVVVSVPWTGSEATCHVKGRVLEAAMAGACLLEWRNPATAAWFEPRRDYWEYESVENCVEEAKWLAGKPRLVREMAENLKARVEQEHAPAVFWSKVFGAVEDARGRS